MKKLLSLFVCLLLAVSCFSSLIGCGGGGDKLVIWSFTDEIGKMVNNYYLKSDLEDKPEFEIKNVEVNDLVTKLDSALKAKKNLPDIIAIEQKYIRKYAESGNLEDLSSLAEFSGEMYDYTKNAAKDKNGNVVAYAWQATPGVLYYRTDLAKTYLNVNNPEEMQEKVDTWEHFIETAQILNQSHIKILSDLGAPSRAFLADRDGGWTVKGNDGSETLSIDPKLYTGEDGYNLFDVMKALQVGDGVWGRETQEECYVNQTTERTTAWFADMSQDNVFSFMLPAYSLNYDLKANCENKVAGTTTAGKWAICKGPLSYFDGGTWLGVIKGSDKAEKAKEIIKYFTMDENFLRQWATDTGDFMNNKKLMKEFAADDSKGSDFLTGKQNQYKIFGEVAAVIKGDNMTPYDSNIGEMFKQWAANYAKLDSSLVPGITEANARREALAGFIEGVEGAYPKITVIENPVPENA